MSKLSRKQRDEELVKLDKEFTPLGITGKNGKKWIREMEDFFYELWMNKSPDEYFQGLFHVYFLATHLGVEIMTWELEKLLPQASTTMIDDIETKGVPALKTLTSVPSVIPDPPQPCPLVTDVLGIEKRTSIIPCNKCYPLNTDVEWFEKQTRSADEPMTIFAFCKNCKTRWKQ